MSTQDQPSESKFKSPVLKGAIQLPIFKVLADKRVVLASSSPRRKEILEKVGFVPEIIPSTFAEDLPKSQFAGQLADYPIATAAEKAIEVYERLVREDDRNPANLVIGADTVVIFPPESETAEGGISHGQTSEILEKPFSPEEQRRNLSLMSGRACEIVTGVCIVYPTVEAPGYKLRSMSHSSIAHFYDNDDETIQAYVDHGEGHDRAGGFATQGVGGLLIERMEGCPNNIAGFPLAAFWKWMGDLHQDGTFDDI